jgi:hypothetical protein
MQSSKSTVIFGDMIKGTFKRRISFPSKNEKCPYLSIRMDDPRCSSPETFTRSAELRLQLESAGRERWTAAWK